MNLSKTDTTNKTKHIVVCTHSLDDDGLDVMLRALERRQVPYLRFDSDRCPSAHTRCSVSFKQGILTGEITVGDVTLTLAEMAGFWLRRYRPAVRAVAELRQAEPSLPHTFAQSILQEGGRAMEALFAAINASNIPQINTLERVQRADNKMQQLLTAQSLGLAVPDTYYGNDPQLAQAFYQENRGKGRGTIAKAHDPIRYEGQKQKTEMSLSTQNITDAEADFAGLEVSPMIIQQRIEKRIEIRSFVVGERVWSASIDPHQHKGAAVDWRVAGLLLHHTWQKYRLDAEIEQKLVKLVAALGLKVASCDLIVEPNGHIIFLEANAGGEWFWLDDLYTHEPSNAMVDALLGLA